MDSATDREREVANCLFQIDKLRDADLRAVIRHLATDDAVFSEAQCSHIAGVIDGTLHQKPRDSVNAKLNCTSGFAAAVNWEKNFASYAYPGHVSAVLRDSGNDDQDDMQINEVSSKLPPAVSEGDGEHGILLGPRNTFNSTNVPGHIINKGHMDVHYHQHYYYNKHSPSDKPIPTTVPMKREREDDDEHYLENPSSLVVTNEPRTNDTASNHPSKRSKTENDNTETETAQAEVKADGPSLVKEAKHKHVEGKICRHCKIRFIKRDNKVKKGNLPCRTHTSGLVPYPPGLERKTKGGIECFYQAWSCCDGAPPDPGCVYTIHSAE